MGLFFNKKSQNGELGKFNLRHLLGLDIPEVNCNVIVYQDKLIIVSGDREYNLNLEKIRSVDFDMNVNIEKYSKSSTLKGVVGAATFGVAGAIIGSTPKTNEKRNVTCKAIINYETNSESSYIVLEDFQANMTNGAAKLVDTLRPLIKKREVKQHIEL